MTQVAVTYAEALYSLARDEGQCEQILEEMTVLADIFAKETDFLRLLATPALSKQERCAVLDDTLRGKVCPYLLNFLKILTEEGYIGQFSACARSYRDIYNQDHDILPVTAVTALPLTETAAKSLVDKLTGLTGKTVDLTNRIDPNVLGGIRLDYDGRRIDGTVQNRLDAVRELLKNTVL